jgi:hypothetical protein
MSTPAEKLKPNKGAGRQDSKQAGRKDGKSAPRRPSKKGAIETLMKKFEKTLEEDGVKLTVGEYIRLMQLRKELNVEEPKEIKVTWVEPNEKESVTET